jgi:hypothetical protein
MKNLNQDSRSSGRGFNLGPPEYEAEVIIIYFRRKVLTLHINYTIHT